MWPADREPAHADAIVVLSGDGDRVPAALRRMDRDVAPTLVFAGLPDTEEGAALCRDPQPFEVICLRPSPDNTRTEAQAASRLAEDRDWKRLLVVTTRFHVTRSRLLFNRCFDGSVEAVGDYPSHGREFALRLVVHEWLGLVQATFLARGC